MENSTAALLLTTGVAAFATVRFTRIGIYRTLPFLYVFLCYQLFQNCLALAFTPASVSNDVYQAIYEWTEPVTWILEVLMVRELYNRVFKEYPGVASLTRWNSYLAAILAVGLCLLVVLASPTDAHSLQTVLSIVTLWERCVSFAIALFILSMAILLIRFPIRLLFNVACHACIFTAFFLANFIFFEIGTFSPDAFVDARYFGATINYAVCFLCWGLLFRRESGNVVVRSRTPVDEREEERLLGQLSFLNSLLVKTVRH